MTRYDFETLVDRTAMGSSKWAAMHRAAAAHGTDLTAHDGPIAPFSVADLDLPNAPEIIEALQEALAGGLVLGYTVPTEAYLDAVTGWFARRHDWHVEPEWVRVTPGVIPAFTLAIREFTAPGDGVIVNTPAYYPMFPSIESSGRRVVRNPLVEREGRFRIDLDLLEEQARDPRTTALLFASPHNPTGRVWERKELEAVARIVVEHDLLLISDEIHHDLVQPGHRHTVVTEVDPALAERTLVLTSTSKSFNIAGLGIANAVIPDPGMRDRFTRARDDLGFDNPDVLGAVAVQAAYTRAEGWLDELIALVGRNQAVLTAFFAEHVPSARVAPLEGTFLSWVDLRPLGLDAERLARLSAGEAALFLDEGTVFGPEGAGFERFNIATPTPVLEAGLERLRRALDAALA
ncbi:pyridoxal phosphate-dependent aminotransferase [Brachybacterium rhamnosum]|uniref:cysteine-S-conjugate beta-lyase n=1 Tax=Brachybacterium rhamnosum TaxID=173361 RepID=A0ABW4PVF7_9MICO